LRNLPKTILLLSLSFCGFVTCSENLIKPLSVLFQLGVNSWGEEWGEGGMFRIKRGTNECEVEHFVLAAWAQTTTAARTFPGLKRRRSSSKYRRQL